MARLTDEIAWDLDCPQCGKQFRASVAELKDDPMLTCPHCGTKIQIESDGSARETAESLENLDRAWDRLIK